MNRKWNSIRRLIKIQGTNLTATNCDCSRHFNHTCAPSGCAATHVIWRFLPFFSPCKAHELQRKRHNLKTLFSSDNRAVRAHVCVCMCVCVNACSRFALIHIPLGAAAPFKTAPCSPVASSRSAAEKECFPASAQNCSPRKNKNRLIVQPFFCRQPGLQFLLLKMKQPWFVNVTHRRARVWVMKNECGAEEKFLSFHAAR